MARLGLEWAIVPKANQPKAKIAGSEVIAVEHVDQAVQVLRGLYLSGYTRGYRRAALPDNEPTRAE